MKKPHNMKSKEERCFKHLGELQEFAETYEYNSDEFSFKCDSSGYLIMVKK